MLFEEKLASEREQMLPKGLISISVYICVDTCGCVRRHLWPHEFVCGVCPHVAVRPGQPSPSAKVAGVPVSPKRAGFYVASSS